MGPVGGVSRKNGNRHTLMPAGEGGLPLGPDGKPIDPRGIAEPKERDELDRARVTKPIKVAGVAPGEDNGADLPFPLIALLVLTTGAILATAAPRIRDLVRRRLG